MSKIISIGTALPRFCHRQQDILKFMQLVYAMDNTSNRKLKFLYEHSGIDFRYSVIPDYSAPSEDWTFYPQSEDLEPFPSIEKRMDIYRKTAFPLAIAAIQDAIEGQIVPGDITHLITVSCTGMSAPGLDLQIVREMGLPRNIYRTSVNFMGCYAAIHALKLADAVCKHDEKAKVVIVCTELCTLHFQKKPTVDNITSSLLFGDGSAAALVTADNFEGRGLRLESFYAEIIEEGSKDMSWEISSSGFLMTLSGYVPELLQQDFAPLVDHALQTAGVEKAGITDWCIHPGGKRILDAIHKSLQLPEASLSDSYEALRETGNLSSATILFALKKI
ncbi:MAG TPA: type III polyketide synthase, partial [Chitinophagaceae bacterium]